MICCFIDFCIYIILFVIPLHFSNNYSLYCRITTFEQRQAYKTVFDEKFEEYKSLQDDLPIYEKYLQSLQHTAKMYSKGSDEYKVSSFLKY